MADVGEVCGIALGIIGALVGVLGASLARHSFVAKSSYPATVRWLLGAALSVFVSPAISGVSLLFCPASLVASMGAFAILFNIATAAIVLGERPTSQEILGSILVFGGIITTVLTARDGAIGTLDRFGLFLQTLDSRPARLYVVGVALLFAICIGVHLSSAPSVLSITQPLLSPSISAAKRHRTLGRLGLGCAAGLCSCATTLAGKSLVLGLTSSSTNPVDLVGQLSDHGALGGLLANLTAPSFLACLATFATLGVVDLALLNASLRSLEVLYFIPVRNAVILISGNLGGMTLFRETHSSVGIFAIGLCATAAGMLALSLPPKTERLKSGPPSPMGPFAHDVEAGASYCGLD